MVSNHGYHANENDRSESWSKSLAFSPYAVDTPIGGPTDGRINSLSIPEKRQSNGSSKNSEYSFVSADNENPYAAPSEVISAYDHIPGQELGRLPPPRLGTKKTNLTYESSAVIQHQIHHHRETKTVKTDNPKEGYEEDEHSNCCRTIFIGLVGIIALFALLMVFLIVFGTISVKKCKECDVVEVPKTGAQSGGSTGGNSNALLLEIEKLRKNLTSLHQIMNNLQKPQNAKIAVLESEIAGQKLQVASLSDELAKQKNATNTLNQTTTTLRASLSQTTLKMAAMNVTQQIRYMLTTRSVENVRAGLMQNLTQTRENVADIHSNMTRNLEEMEASLRNDLIGKISTNNFTKLINDAQGVVDELYGMINTSIYKRNELNETIHVLDKSLSNQMGVLLNASTTLEQNMTLYGEMLSKLKNTSSNSLTDCVFTGNGRFKDITAGAEATAKLTVKANPPKNTRVISATCDVTADRVRLSKKDGEYECECTGIKASETSLMCYIRFLYCPI